MHIGKRKKSLFLVLSFSIFPRGGIVRHAHVEPMLVLVLSLELADEAVNMSLGCRNLRG